MHDPIRQAIVYANADKHDGHGYTLRIRLVGGKNCEVVVMEMEEDDIGYSYLLGYYEPELPEVHERPVFFQPEQIVAVEVLW